MPDYSVIATLEFGVRERIKADNQDVRLIHADGHRVVV